MQGPMQNQMEEEDTDGESGNGDESDEGSEEEELPLLNAQNQDFTNSMNMNDGHDSAQQYHQNNMAKGARYQDKQHLKDAIIQWAISTNRGLKTTVLSDSVVPMDLSSSTGL